MIASLAMAMLAGLSSQASLASSQVSVASGDWSNIPLVRNQGTLRISTEAVEQIEAAAFGECAKPGQSDRHLKLTIPFLIRFSPQGSVEQVVVRRMNCPRIEQVAGGAVLQIARDGGYRPTGENLEHWYRGEINIKSSN